MRTAQTETQPYACRQCGQPVEVVGARNRRTGQGVAALVAAIRPAPLQAVRCRTCGGNADWRDA